jgi:hypothetical protein
MTEVWLRGPLPDYPPLLMPVAHALLQAREDIERLAGSFTADRVWMRPGGAASLGYHLLHTAGSLDRLCTYARGDRLSAAQLSALAAEDADHSSRSLGEVAGLAVSQIDRALAQVRSTSEASLLEARRVGRAGLPSTVIGLLVHAAEHTTRHVGQAITTARIVGTIR